VGNFYDNHPLSGTSSANLVACLNSGVTVWSNVVYNVSVGVYIPTEPPPTVEPRKSSSLTGYFFAVSDSHFFFGYFDLAPNSPKCVS
jgi:hypothetical protein